ncbi:MAG: hypothetical protein ABIH37_00290 [archaeon]
MVVDDQINDIEEFCPKCGSDDVIIEYKSGYYCFNRCKKCGYVVKGSCLVDF